MCPARPTHDPQHLSDQRASSQRSFYRALGSGAEGSRAVDLAPGVQATMVPARPWFSIFNAVVYEDLGALRDSLARLPAVYDEAGVQGWSIWVRPEDQGVDELLAAEGYELEAAPLAMGASLGDLDLPPQAEPELGPAPTWSELARVNDSAHEILPEWSMAAAFSSMDDSASHLYAARLDGRVAAGLLGRHCNGDCYFWFVATAPEAQRRGLGRKLMLAALHDAVATGCTTATLESTEAGEALYRSLGFTELGRCGRWARYSG